MMRVAFIVLLVIGASYFGFKRRRFDFFSVGFASAVIYFMPGIFGFTQYPGFLVPLEEHPLYWMTYVVMMMVVAAIVIGAFVYDIVSHRVHHRGIDVDFEGAGTVALILGGVGMVLSVWTLGATLFDPEKTELLVSSSRWMIFWELGASLAAVFLIARKRYFLASLAAPLLLFDLYVGFRVSFVMTLIAVAALVLNDSGRARFAVKRFRIALGGVMVFAFFLIYKAVYVAIKLNAWDYLRDRFRSADLYISSVTRSEPFTTQTILNEVLVSNFHVGMWHFGSLLLQFVFFAPALGAKDVSFNDLFQHVLFPQVYGWGMANNIWAEMWSSGGWVLLTLFIGFYVAMLWLGSEMLRVRTPELRAFAALFFSYWTFYIHRNDLAFEVNLLKRVTVVGSFCLLCAAVLSAIARRARRASRSELRGA